MIDGIIRWSLNNRIFVLSATLFLTGWGLRETRQMPLDVFPDLTAPTVTVITEAHGMAPEETERLITFPIESSLNGASGVRRVRSATSVGVSVIWVEFDWGADIYNARQIVAEKLQLAMPSLPPEIAPPVLAPISSIMGEILFVGLEADDLALHELRAIADWEIRRRLLAVTGVSQVVPIGGGASQFQVQVRPADLAKYGVSLGDVADAVGSSNKNSSAGFYEHGGQEYLIYGMGRVAGPDDVAKSVLVARDEGPVLISDVADVVLGPGLMRGSAAIDGKSAVILGIQKQPDVNTLELTKRLERALDEIEENLPTGVKLQRHLLRQADFIETGIENVQRVLLEGALLVVLIIGVFLMNGTATLITALAIPISLIAAALVLAAFGCTLNVMTLGGMAIAVGALVDDAIIDVENVVRRLREARSSDSKVPIHEIVFQASKEVRSSIVFATIIIAVVFTPLFFLHGVEGRLLQPLGIAYVVSLGASLVVALTLTPVLCVLLLPRSKSLFKRSESTLIRWLKSRYQPLLTRALSRWSLMTWAAVIGLLIAIAVGFHAGRAFLPSFNEGALTISVVTFPGTSLSQSDQIGTSVERLLLARPEVISTSRRTGRAELDEHAQGTHASEIDVRLRMGENTQEQLLKELRGEFDKIPGVNIVIGQPISHRIDHMISGTKANIAVKVFGPNLATLGKLAKQTEASMRSIPGVVDLAVEEQANLPIVIVRWNRDALARYQLKVSDVSETIETAFYGRKVSQVVHESIAHDLIVKFSTDARHNLDAIRQTMIPTPRGSWVPLEALADIRRDRGPNQISRENGQRKVVVMCNVGEGRDLGSVVEEIRQRVNADIALPPGYYIEYGGQFEAAEEATRTLSLLSLMVVLGVFFLLYAAFGSVRDSLIILSSLPLALMGGVLGVVVSGGVISVASLIGFIALFGIATRNGIMLVTHIRYLIRVEGVVDLRDAVIRGASERLAPILMTALASGLGLLPLALAFGEPGNEIQAPMAVVILFGLATSTVMSMFLVPAAMLRFGERDELLKSCEA